MAVRFSPATHILKLVLIRLAINSPPEMVTNAFHEAFHDLELHLFRQHQLDLMIRETPRLRQMVAQPLRLYPSRSGRRGRIRNPRASVRDLRHRSRARRPTGRHAAAPPSSVMKLRRLISNSRAWQGTLAQRSGPYTPGWLTYPPSAGAGRAAPRAIARWSTDFRFSKSRRRWASALVGDWRP